GLWRRLRAAGRRLRGGRVPGAARRAAEEHRAGRRGRTLMPRVAGQIDVDKTEAILEAAGQVLAERGLSAPIEEIARRAGVAKQTIYNRYGGKDSLIRATIERRVEAIVAPLLAPDAGDHPEETLADFARSLLEAIVRGVG